MVGINVGEDEATVTAWIKDNVPNNMSYAVALDPKNSVKASYPTPGIPHEFVVGR